MAKIKSELVAILRQYDIDPKEAVWDCHGTLVIYHRFCEIIAAKARIKWDPPHFMESNGLQKCVAVCVTGHMGDRTEWATGEAAPGNNKNSYPYAMAEKRAKDRVILKLVGLSGFVYSEDEADDFREGPKGTVEVEGESKPATASQPRAVPPPPPPPQRRPTTPQRPNGGPPDWHSSAPIPDPFSL